MKTQPLSFTPTFRLGFAGAEKFLLTILMVSFGRDLVGGITEALGKTIQMVSILLDSRSAQPKGGGE